ncbi:hypothetical protein [Streptomyces sp. CA-111067]|uniref:hypothetical protein n=1 Tax=Streptomyces sp. CA-111067 TaxID=3240046 RepID=UPI003D97BF4E
MDASTAAIAGAAIGALGGLGGGWLTMLGQGRHQDRQRDAERERWRDDVRRQAYNDCVASTKQLSAAWWKMSDLLWAAGSTPEHWQAGFITAHDAWTRFSASVAAVAIVGPRSVADRADVLRQSMYDWDMIGMAWHDAARCEGHGRLDSFARRFKVAAEAKRSPDREFQAAARQALGTDD